MELIRDISTNAIRWVFTWAIALLPIIFQFYRQYILEGGINLAKLSETGEFFIVSIVMVAEPLALLVMSKNRNVISLIFSFLIIVMLVTAGYLFCLNELKENVHTFFGDLYKREVQSRLNSVSLFCMVWSMGLGLATIINIQLGNRNKAEK